MVCRAVGIAEVWPCRPLERAAISIVVFGAITVLVGLTCCCFVFPTRGYTAIVLCAIVGFLLLLALAAAATESSYGLGNKYNTMRTNHSHNNDGCTKYDSNGSLPVSLVVVSYVLLTLMCFYFIATCINAITGKHRTPFLYK